MSFQLYPGQLEQLKEMLLRGCRHKVPKADPDLEAIKNADLLTWSKHFLPHYFTKPPSEMHKWLAGQLDKISARPN
jgi:hypothetical protein